MADRVADLAAANAFAGVGAEGHGKMMEHLEAAFQYDIRIRAYDDRLHPDGAAVLTKEIEKVLYTR